MFWRYKKFYYFYNFLSNKINFFKEFFLRGYYPGWKFTYEKQTNDFPGYIQYRMQERWLYVVFSNLKNNHLNFICQHFGFKYASIIYRRLKIDYMIFEKYITSTYDFLMINCSENSVSLSDCSFLKRRIFINLETYRYFLEYLDDFIYFFPCEKYKSISSRFFNKML